MSALLTRLFDDAAFFPPGRTPMAAAPAAYRAAAPRPPAGAGVRDLGAIRADPDRVGLMQAPDTGKNTST